MTPHPTAQVLRVDLDQRSYDIHVGPGLIRAAGELIRPVMEQARAIVITDENVAAHHLKPLMASLASAGIEAQSITLAPGEQSKSFAGLEDLVERLLEMKIERTTTLIALGGGVIGDLVGFAASVTLRGVPFVQMPTTLLSQVDSSVGGKTGINTRFGKNLAGAFYQPRLVLADVDTLNTLDARQVRSGYAEVVKYGLIEDKKFFAWLEENGAKLIDGDTDARIHAVLTSCRAKAKIVAEDERETGRRALLNLGHTFGHALEAQSGYSDKLLHGEAVAIGTVMAFELSVQMGLCPKTDLDRMTAHFENVGLPLSLGAIKHDDWTTDQLIEHMSRDKKVKDTRIVFILTRGIGDAFINDATDMPSVITMLNKNLNT